MRINPKGQGPCKPKKPKTKEDKPDDESLEFVKNSIKDSLESDDRIGGFDLELSYVGDGVVNVLLNVDGTGFEFNLGEE